MGNLFLVLTKRVLDQWAEYYKYRPQEVKPDLTDILEDVFPLTTADVDFTPTPGVKTFGHAEYPGIAFLAVEEHGERTFIGFRERRRKAKQKVQLVAPPPTIDLTVPTGLTPKEVRNWVKAKRDEITLTQLRGGFPQREVLRLQLELNRIDRDALTSLTAESQATDTAKRTDQERGEDREHGWVRNFIEEEIKARPEGDAKAALTELLLKLKSYAHRPTRRIGGVRRGE